jgi:hypothetical protein
MLTVPTFFKKPTDARMALRQINIVRRAESLWADGYKMTVNNFPKAAPFYDVTSPDGTEYRVDLLCPSCTCKSNEGDGDCKHRIAVALKVDEDLYWETRCAEYERLIGDAETSEGCDPYAEF